MGGAFICHYHPPGLGHIRTWLRAGYKLDFLAGSPYWEKAILCRWIVLFFYVMTTDVLLVLVPSRLSEVWDQTLCSIPGYLLPLPPQELGHFITMLRIYHMANVQDGFLLHAISIQELISLWFSLQLPLPSPPGSAAGVAQSWPGEPEGTCRNSAEWGHPASSPGSHPVATRQGIYCWLYT